MGTTLNNAVSALRALFPAQRQGDCGIFSFYYAAHLIQHMRGAKGRTVLSVDPPRSRYHQLTKECYEGFAEEKKNFFQEFHNPMLTPRDRHVINTSIRKFAKTTFDSAQGEVFSAGEMSSIITHYGYGYRLSTTASTKARRAFIAEALKRDNPVLIPYWSNDDGFPVASDHEAGAHWSVIFDEAADNYHYLNPWYPSTQKQAPTYVFLKSNENVDNKLYDPIWEKSEHEWSVGETHDVGRKLVQTSYSAMKSPPAKPNPKTQRNLYKGGRKQELANVLFEIFASETQLAAL